MTGGPVREPGDRLFRLLLRLYPPGFRDRFGDEMLDFYRERRRVGGPWIWPGLLLNLLGTAAAERFRREPDTPAERVTMGNLIRDIRLAFRSLARTPGFTAVVLLTLALGIGANAAIFSVVNGVLLKPLPFPNPETLVDFRQQSPYSTVSEPEFRDYRRDMRTLERLAAWTSYEANLTGDQDPVRITGARVSDGFFEVTGVAPLLGRTFDADEQKPAQVPAPVIVISEAAWQTWFGSDPGILAREVRLNGVPRRVIGVMPARFAYPSTSTAVWLPLRLNYDSLWTRNNHYLLLVGRLRPGATARQADVEANLLTRRWMKDFPETYFPDQPLRAEVKPLVERVLNNAEPYLLTLFGAVGFVLLIACVNVANLLLIRGENRRREVSIRTALGATSGRLASQQLAEAGLLALGGGGLGILLAWALVRILVRSAPGTLPRLDEVGLDLRVLLFTLAVAVGTGLLFGLMPARRISHGDQAAALRDGTRAGPSRAGTRARRLLVTAEVALAVVMLSGAGLLIKSLRELQAIDIGFESEGVLTARLNLPPLDYREDGKVILLVNRLEEQLRATPGVTAAGVMGWTPVVGNGGTWSIQIDGREAKEIAQAPSADPLQVSPGFFRTLGVRMVRGRPFTEQDREDAPPVVIINEAMARQLWPGQDPVGRTLKMFNPQAPWATIVGVMADIKTRGVEAPAPMTMVFPWAQTGKSAYFMPRQMTVIVRTPGNPARMENPLRRIVRELDRGAPVSDVRSMEEALGTALASRRFSTLLLGWFAALALLLAGVGIYGVIAYGVSQRTYEIGLRQALGADRRSVLGLIVRDGLRLTAGGLAIGLLATLATGRLIATLLVNVRTTDPVTMGLVALLLAGVAGLASWIPARRAMAVSPTEALRGG